MKKTIAALAALTLAVAAHAQAPHASPTARRAVTLAHCESCGTVQSVVPEKRKGSGGAVGLIGGAVVGGLLGNQIGGGTGRKLATVGGAAAGAYAGNEVQKQYSSTTVWVTKVRMKDGTVHSFAQDTRPVWVSGHVVKVSDGRLVMP